MIAQMIAMMNGFKLPAGLVVSAWLAFAGSAQAGIIILDDPLSPPDQVVFASNRGCIAGRMDVRLAPLLKKLVAYSNPSAPVAAPVIPPVSQADPGSLTHVARYAAPSGRVLMIGVAF
jgi:hypothetical protein